MVIDLKTGKSTAVTAVRRGRARAARRLPGRGRRGRVRRVRATRAAARRWSSSDRARTPGSRCRLPLAEAERPELGVRDGPPHRRHDGRGHLLGRGEQQVPGLPGAHQLPDLRQGPAGRRAELAARRTEGKTEDDPAQPVRRSPPRDPAAAPTPGRGTRRRSWPGCCACTRRPRSRPRSSPRRSSRCWWSPAPARARPRRWPRGWSGWSPTGTPTRTRSSASPSPARRPANWPTGSAPGSASWSAGSAGTTQFAGEATVSTYHSYAARVVTEHGLRAGYEPSARLLTEAARWQIVDSLVRSYTGEMTGAEPRADHGHRRRARARRRAGRAPGHAGRAGRLDRPVLRRGAGAARPGLQGRHRHAPPPAAPAHPAAPGAAVRAAQARPGGDGLRRPDGPGGAGRPRPSRRSARSSAAASRSCCWTSTRTPATPRWCMLNALFGGGHPVTAVGDPCQSIYGWRGASAGTLDRFPSEFTGPGGRDAWVLSLTRSWRNRPEILHVANALSRPLRAAGARVAELVPAQRVASPVGGRTVTCALLPTYADEAEWIADSMLTAWRLSAGLPRDAGRRDPAGEAADQRRAGPGAQPDPGDRGGAALARPAGRGGRPGRPAGHPRGTRRGVHAAGAGRPDRRRVAAAPAHRRALADRPA